MTITDAYISAKCSEISGLIIECKSWAVSDPKLGAHLALYIDVIILGALEECFEHLVKQRAKKPGDKEIADYIARDIANRFRNPNYKQICGILGQFGDKYKDDFQKTFGDSSAEADALKSLLENKTNIAHFGLTNLNLSLTDVDTYFQAVVTILEKLEDMLVIHP